MAKLSPSPLIVQIFFGILEKEKRKKKSMYLQTQGRLLTRQGPGADRGRTDEAASPIGQAILSSVPSHKAPEVCNFVVNLQWGTLDNIPTNLLLDAVPNSGKISSLLILLAFVYFLTSTIYSEIFRNISFSSPGKNLPVKNCSSRVVTALMVKRHRQGKVCRWC